MDHAAVPAAGAPAKFMRLKERDGPTMLGEARRSHYSCVAAANDDNIDVGRQRCRGPGGGRGRAPPVGLLAIVSGERCYA
jgi:hypothetical protein